VSDDPSSSGALGLQTAAFVDEFERWAHRKAIEAGAREMLAPQDFAGGRFAILGDPQGATFGLLKMARQ